MTAEEMRDAAAKECDMCPDSHWGPWLAARIRAIPIPPDPVREELLAALKAMVAEYVSNVDAYRTGGWLTHPETETHVIAARAAIAKAEAKP